MNRVLVAEDQAAISLWIEDVLADAGYTVAGPFSYCARAEEWLKANTPDLAVLDVTLGDGPSIEIAQTLRERGVPVLFFSGQSARQSLPAELADLPWVAKPATADDLLAALRSLQAPSAAD